MNKPKNTIKKRFSKLADNDFAIVLAALHTAISIVVSRHFFDTSEITDIGKLIKFGTHIILPVLLFFIYRAIIKIWRQRILYKSLIKTFFIYLIVLLAVFFLSYPGVWRNDEMGTALLAKTYSLDAWQHSLTSVFYIFSYKLIPTFSGVVITQCLTIALITTYLYSKTVAHLKPKKIYQKCVLFIPFILPPVIDSALYPIRMTLYSYILILSIFLFIEFSKRRIISRKNLIILISCLIITCAWRSEGLIFLPFFIIILFTFFKKKKISLRYLAYSAIGLVIGVLGVSAFQDVSLSPHQKLGYNIAATADVIAELVRHASVIQEDNTQELEAINKVLNVEAINNSDLRGEQIYWSEAYNQSFSDEEYSGYMKAVLKLATKYPGVAIKNRIKDFLTASAFYTNESNVIWDTTNDLENHITERITNFFTLDSRFTRILTPRIRKATIRLLEGRSLSDYNKTNLLYVIFWNLIPPILAIIIATIWLVWKKKYIQAILFCSILAKTAAVFITAPAPYFMYYLPEYIFGYIIIVGGLVRLAQRKEKK